MTARKNTLTAGRIFKSTEVLGGKFASEAPLFFHRGSTQRLSWTGCYIFLDKIPPGVFTESTLDDQSLTWKKTAKSIHSFLWIRIRSFVHKNQMNILSYAVLKNSGL